MTPCVCVRNSGHYFVHGYTQAFFVRELRCRGLHGRKKWRSLFGLIRLHPEQGQGIHKSLLHYFTQCHVYVPDIQNEIINLMSEIVKEHIVKEVGESWYTLKVDATKDPTGCENIFVLRYVDDSCRLWKILLNMITSKKYDALSLTEQVIT